MLWWRFCFLLFICFLIKFVYILHFTFKTSFAEVKQEYVGLSLTENATIVCFESLYPSDPGYKHEEKYL